MAWRVLSQDEARARRRSIEGLAGNNALAEEDAASTTDLIELSQVTVGRTPDVGGTPGGRDRKRQRPDRVQPR
jgi:hypothetical protein